jgi:hypothetical protein
MDLYRHDVKPNASLTLGANTENTRLTEGNMYLVFVGAADKIP